MPLIKPKKRESKDDFIDRCMSNDTMKKEYDQKQRAAICYDQWDKYKNGGNSMSYTRIPEKAFIFDEQDDGNRINLTKSEDSPIMEMEAYSGGIIRNHFIWDKLAIDVSGIRFGKPPYPILEQHDSDRKIGVANKKPDISDNKVKFSGIQVLNNEDAQEFYNNSKEGFPYQASVKIIGSKLEELAEGEKAEVNGYTLEGPGVIFRESQFKEASVCVFGADPKTSAQAFDEDNDNMYEVELVGGEEEEHEFANNPKYDGTETKDWSKVSKDFSNVVKAYGKQENVDVSEYNNVSDLPSKAKTWIKNLTLNGRTNTDEWSVLFSYPVVNPNTKKLNKNALSSAKAYAAQHGPQDVYDKADKLFNKHWSESKNNEEEDNMDIKNLAEFKENYPELYNGFAGEFAEAIKDVESFKQHLPQLYEVLASEIQKNLEASTSDKDRQIEELKDQNKGYEQRLAQLERNETIRIEKERQAFAQDLIDQSLNASNIPVYLHEKVKKQMNYQDFVENDSEGIKVEEFKEAIKNEINDWEENLSKAYSSPVIGLASGEQSNNFESSDSNDVDSDVSRMLDYIGQGQNE